MIPDGGFKVWVETADQLRAVLGILDSAKIKWKHGEGATQFVPQGGLPIGLNIGKDWLNGGSPIISITYNRYKDMWESVDNFDAPIYTVHELVAQSDPQNYDSVFDAIAF